MNVKSEIVEISDELFGEIGKMITQRYGIKMPPEKKIMFQSRLQHRLHELEINSFEEYTARLLNDTSEPTEFDLLADFISTNKTEFFREKDHFHFLNTVVLPIFFENGISRQSCCLKFWSAGCSNGQEAYSIGIQLEEFIRESNIRFNYSIMATDISGRMLRQAKDAIYPLTQADGIPLELKHRYFLKGKDTKYMKVRVVKEIRDKVSVGYLNLMEDLYPFQMLFDVVFVRNTLIYFDPVIQLKVLKKVLDSLKPGGYLFIGHSESLINLQLPIQSVAPSVYIKIK